MGNHWNHCFFCRWEQCRKQHQKLDEEKVRLWSTFLMWWCPKSMYFDLSPMMLLIIMNVPLLSSCCDKHPSCIFHRCDIVSWRQKPPSRSHWLNIVNKLYAIYTRDFPRDNRDMARGKWNMKLIINQMYICCQKEREKKVKKGSERVQFFWGYTYTALYNVECTTFLLKRCKVSCKTSNCCLKLLS